MHDPTLKVLLLGADGFIGRHIAFHLRGQGIRIIAQARNPTRLKRMGFATLQADLTDSTTHSPAFWQPHLDQNSHIINAAGLLTGPDKAFQAVHVQAPTAAYTARHPGTQALLISAIGIKADTPFSHWRREGEAAARASQAIILRAGLVLADTTYGGSSLIRALAALPFVTPVIGSGEQPFNPIHASDLAAIALDCLHAPTPGTWEVGRPQTVTQTGLLRATQSWLGLQQSRLLHIPLPMARRLGQIGDALNIGPISATSVAQLQQGVLADPAPLLEHLSLASTADQTALGIALLRNWRPKTTAILQIGMVLGYTLGLSLIAPGFWLDPFGGLLKNLPILALLLAHLALSEER